MPNQPDLPLQSRVLLPYLLALFLVAALIILILALQATGWSLTIVTVFLTLGAGITFCVSFTIAVGLLGGRTGFLCGFLCSCRPVNLRDQGPIVIQQRDCA